jgi:hypothetical protein
MLLFAPAPAHPRVVRPSFPARVNLASPHAVGLVNWWVFAEPAARALDRSPRAADQLFDNGSTRVELYAHPFMGQGWRWNATSDDWRSSTQPFTDTNQAITVACWLVVHDNGLSCTFLNLGTSVDAQRQIVCRYHSGFGTFLCTYGNDVDNVFGSLSPANNTLYHVVYQSSSAGGAIYVNGTSDATATTAATSNSTTGNIYRIGSGGDGDFTLFDVRVWNRVLSAQEIASLYAADTRFDLYAATPAPRRLWFRAPAAGGTTYTQSVSGSVSLAGALVKQTTTFKGGTLSVAGALTKQTNTSMAGTLSTSGALSAIRTLLVSVAGTLGLSGALVKQAQVGRAGTVTPTGALVKQTGRGLAGALSLSGALAAIRTLLASVGGTLGLSGALVKQAQVDRAGTVTPAGTVTKQTGRGLAGALSLSGALAKLTARALTGALSVSGTVAGAIVSLLAVVADYIVRARDDVGTITAQSDIDTVRARADVNEVDGQ